MRLPCLIGIGLLIGASALPAVEPPPDSQPCDPETRPQRFAAYVASARAAALMQIRKELLGKLSPEDRKFLLAEKRRVENKAWMPMLDLSASELEASRFGTLGDYGKSHRFRVIQIGAEQLLVEHVFRYDGFDQQGLTFVITGLPKEALADDVEISLRGTAGYAFEVCGPMRLESGRTVWKLSAFKPEDMKSTADKPPKKKATSKPASRPAKKKGR
jgi:hypothetical protein